MHRSENILTCETCDGPGFCTHLDRYMHATFAKLCRTKPAYKSLYENGPAPRGTETPTKQQPVSGPGTELTAILARFGIRPGGCACKAMAAEMDRNGPDWCRSNIAKIASKMYQQAKKRKMLLASLSPPAIRLLIRWAIHRAEAKAAKSS